MKKSLFLLSFLSLFLTGCPPLPQYQYNEITYKAITRGYSEVIRIKKSETGYLKIELTHLKNNKEVFKRNYKNRELKYVHKMIEKIDLNTIHQLEIPSKKHQYDGAMITTIEITTTNDKYISTSFDDDNPPKELKELVNYLRSLTK